MFKISVFGLSSVFYTSCTKKEPYPFIGKTHKFKNLLNLMTLPIQVVVYRTGNECLEVFVGTPAALGELKVLIAKLFEY